MATTINAGASASISLAAGNVINVTGSGVAVVGAGVRAGSGVRQRIIGRATSGPLVTAATVLLSAVSEMTYSTETPGPSYQPFSASEVSAVKAVVSGDWNSNQADVLAAGGGLVVADDAGNMKGPGGAIPTGGGSSETVVALTVSASQNIDRTTYGNKVVGISTAATNYSYTLTLSGSDWVADDKVTFRLLSAGTNGGVTIGSSSGSIAQKSTIAFGSVGGFLTLRRNSTNTGWRVEQSLPLVPIGGGMEPWLMTAGATFCKATVYGTDQIWAQGSHKTQHSNNGSTGSSLVEIVSEGSLDTNNVTGTYAVNSYSRAATQNVDYSGNWRINAELATFPHYNTTGAFSTAMPSGVAGKRHAALRLNSTRYSDGKHWGGFIIGSQSGALYNGVWAWWDDYGNHIQARGRGTTSEQRDTGTASFTVNDNTAQVALAGSGTITITLPQTPFDGQDLTIFLETGYTGITLSSGAHGATIIGGTVGTTAGSFARFSYRAASTTWRRCG